jgi:hypothetical protein
MKSANLSSKGQDLLMAEFYSLELEQFNKAGFGLA